MTGALTDEHTTVDVDLDTQARCQIAQYESWKFLKFMLRTRRTTEQCENSAEWAGRKRCCGRTVLACTEHVGQMSDFFFCPVCRKHTSSPQWVKA